MKQPLVCLSALCQLLCLLAATLLAKAAHSSGNVGPNRSKAPSRFTMLHAFAGPPKDGQYSYAPLIQDAQGNLYGTTAAGGIRGDGSVFKVNPSGNETLLYSFDGKSDGRQPFGALARDSSGNLYGTTYEGGDFNCNPPITGCGTVFKLDTAHVLTVLHFFESGSDGGGPLGGVILDASGNLYGIAGGGNSYGYGVVYKVNIRTGAETILHRFAGGSDGAYPEYESLLMDSSGDLYGTTQMGGASNFGTVFKVSPSRKETVLYSFAGGTSDGCYPAGGVSLDSSGNLLGTTQQCGSSGYGTVWKLNSTETVLYNFLGGDDGANTYAGVVLDASAISMESHSREALLATELCSC